jgi:hypothetical protein
MWVVTSALDRRPCRHTPQERTVRYLTDRRWRWGAAGTVLTLRRKEQMLLLLGFEQSFLRRASILIFRPHNYLHKQNLLLFLVSM